MRPQAVGSVHRDRPVATNRRCGLLLVPTGEEHHQRRGRGPDHERIRSCSAGPPSIPIRAASSGHPIRGVRDHFKGLQADPIIGENLRMNEIAGAIMGCQLAKLPAQSWSRIESTNSALRTGMEELAGASLEPAGGRPRPAFRLGHTTMPTAPTRPPERIEWLRAEGLPGRQDLRRRSRIRRRSGAAPASGGAGLSLRLPGLFPRAGGVRHGHVSPVGGPHGPVHRPERRPPVVGGRPGGCVGRCCQGVWCRRRGRLASQPGICSP